MSPAGPSIGKLIETLESIDLQEMTEEQSIKLHELLLEVKQTIETFWSEQAKLVPLRGLKGNGD